MRTAWKSLLPILALMLMGGTNASHARIITQMSPSTGPGLGGLITPDVQTPVSTPFPNNDNSVGPSPNGFTFPGVPSVKPFREVAPIDTLLWVEPSEGTSEYYVTETVINQTPLTWDGFQMEMGFGLVGDFLAFTETPHPISRVLPDFDAPDRDPLPASTVFTSVAHDDGSLLWSGGYVAPGASVEFTFSIDTADDWAGANTYDTFTIRQVPLAIPEPGTMLLFGLGAAGLLAWRRRASGDGRTED